MIYFAFFSAVLCWDDSNEVIVYRVMMYANPLLILYAINYTESVLYICLLQGDSGLTYI